MRAGKGIRLLTLILTLLVALSGTVEARAPVAAGDFFTAAIAAGGRIWGANDFGQLGNGQSVNSPVPVPVPGLTGLTQVDAGRTIAIGRKADGTVWQWGDQQNPRQVSGLAGVSAVSAGSSHYLALKTDGTVWAWGWNAYGQVGDGSTTTRYSPVQVTGLSGVVAIAAGQTFSMALKSDGTVWTWGSNSAGQVGDGTTTQRLSPVQVTLPAPAASVSAGDAFAVALLTDGTVWTWGNGGYGQLGIGAYGNRPSPVQVAGLTGVTAVVAGFYHAMALTSGGTVMAWGANSSGQLGDGTTSARLTPVAVAGLSGVTQLAAGASHSLAVTTDGTVWSWGGSDYGQLGDGTQGRRSTPAQVPGLSGVAMVTAGFDFSLALKADETLYGWGGNFYRQLGFAPPPSNPLPAKPTGFLGDAEWLQQVAGGQYHTLALKADGTVWSWGSNQFGQLGDGTTRQRTTPQQVPGLTDIIAVAAGQSHSVAVRADGTVWTWGRNGSGQLGDGTYTDRNTPAQVPGLQGVVDVVTGDHLTLALKSDGTVWGWGWNIYGELGDGTTTGRNTPVRVSSLTDVVEIAEGMARKADGTVWAWGYNGSGRVGDGTTTTRTSPVQVTGITDAVAIGSSGGTSYAIRAGGTVWAWGANNQGQVGDGTTTNRALPVQVPGLTDVVAVTGGLYHSLAVRRDGTVWAWGYNLSGQLGTGTFTSSTAPVQVSGLNVLPPQGRVLIQQSPYTRTTEVSLTLSAPASATGSLQMRFSADGAAWTAWQPFAAVSSYQLPTAPGFKRVQVQFRDEAGTVWTGMSDHTTLVTGKGTATLPLAALSAGQTGLTLPFTYTADAGGMNGGSLSINIPDGWSAPSLIPANAGYVTAGAGTVSVSGRTITVSGVTLAAGQTLAVTYGDRSGGGTGATAPLIAGGSVFLMMQSSAPGTPMAVLHPLPTVSLFGADGSGSLSLPAMSVSAGQRALTLPFTYTAGTGGMSDGAVGLTIPDGWSAPSTGATDEGYVKASAGAVSVSGRTIHVSGVTLAEGASLTITYGDRSGGGAGVTASTTPGTASFTGQSKATPGGTLAPLEASPVATVYAADGNGALALPATNVSAGQTGLTLAFTYTAAAGGLNNGSVALTVPTGWTPPSATASAPGYTTASTGLVTASGQTIKVDGVTLSGGATLIITYSAATASATPGTASFAGQSKATAGGTLTNLSAPASATVYAADGSGTLTLPETNLSAGQTGRTLTFTYTAAAGGMKSGAVTLTVPVGWTTPSTTASAPGYTTASTGTVTVTGQTIKVDNVTLGAGATLTVTYSAATASATPGAATFTGQSKATAGGTLKPLNASPVTNVFGADGSGTLTVDRPTVTQGEDGATLTFTYTAAPGGMKNGIITVAVPTGWSAPGTLPAAEGYVTASTGTVTTTGQTIRVTGVTLAGGATLTITYGDKRSGGPGATVPDTTGTALFAAVSATVETSTPAALASPPSVTLVPDIQPAPAGLTVQRVNGAAVVSWIPNPGEGITYRVYKATTPFAILGPQNQLKLAEADFTLVGGRLQIADRFIQSGATKVTYYYWVTAVDSTGAEGLVAGPAELGPGN
jgi:alpha-tubulin suppressor-like RCC1 family protein